MRKSSKIGIAFLSLTFFFSVLAGCTNNQNYIAANIVAAPQKENILYETTNKEIEVCFTPKDDCEKVLIDLINKSTDIKCVFYDMNLEGLINALEDKKADVIIDNDNALPQFNVAYSDASTHDKFCIFDAYTVATGSLNPTERGVDVNNNDLFVLYSKTMAQNYLDEFNEIKKGIYGKGEPVEYPKVYLNNHLVENYFAPEDHVEEHIIEYIENAKESIYFMTFSFTDDEIGQAVMDKYNQGIEVKGIFEKSQNSKWSEYKKMKDLGIDVIFDKNSYNMHYKTWIIDNRTVITGSYNPSKNADERNDENIIIINDEEVAQKYLNEFNTLWLWWSS